MANAPSPEQVQAIQAMLQQTAVSGAADEVALTINVTIQKAAIDLQTVVRAMVLEGTAIAADLDQVIVKTAQGEFLLNAQQLKDQAILNLLPARVAIQMRPGPNGLEAVLVMANKPQPNKPIEGASASAASLASAQTLVPEIPKIGQVHQALVLPSTLFGAPTQQQQGKPATANPAGPAPTTASAGDVKGAQAPIPVMADAPEIAVVAKVQNHLQATQQTIQQTTQQAVTQSLTPSAAQLLGTDKLKELATATAQKAVQQMELPGQKTVTAGTDNPTTITDKRIAQVSNPQPNNTSSGQNTAIRIVTVVPPDQTGKTPLVPPTAQNADEQTFVATVKGNLPSGQPIISIGDQTLAIRSPRSWPVGTQLLVSMGSAAALLNEKELAALEPRQWEALRQAVEHVAQQNPTLFREILGQRMPQAGNPQQMAGAMLFLFNALNKGDFTQWMSKEFADRLEILGRTELVRQIQEEWQNRSFMAEDTNHGAWKGMTIPFMDQDKLQQFRFYVHEQPRNNKGDSEERAQARRFLIEMSLSRLGPIQLEGLVHKKKLDIMVRTEAPLERSLQDDLTVRFTKAMEEVRYAGTLTFRANRTGWVDIHARTSQHIAKQV